MWLSIFEEILVARPASNYQSRVQIRILRTLTALDAMDEPQNDILLMDSIIIDICVRSTKNPAII